MDAGLITPEQAATSLNKNLVTRALGVEDVVMLETNEHRSEVGDIYLMCSDGLSDMVSDEDIAAIMLVQEDLDTKAKALIDAANAGGGRDNISVLLIAAKDGQAKRGFMSRLLGK
jgi:PPM family protein phosphatase